MPKATPVYLRDIWPTQDGGAERFGVACGRKCSKSLRRSVRRVTKSGRAWKCPRADLFEWDERVHVHPSSRPSSRTCHGRARPLRRSWGSGASSYVGDSITTDHISPAGAIAKDSPAGKYLISMGLSAWISTRTEPRRGNHEVMVRGTFANIRLAQSLVPGRKEGGPSTCPPGADERFTTPHLHYREEDIPLIVLAGKEYGTGLPGLGGEGHVFARGAGRHRGKLRTDSSQQLGRHGRPAPSVQGRGKCGNPRAYGPRGVQHRRPVQTT